MRIVAACVLALFATCAVAGNFVWDEAQVQYSFTSNTFGSRHLCGFATSMLQPPMIIILTASSTVDDAKPEDKNITVTYAVGAYLTGPGRSGKLESHSVKVVAGRIISDVFNSDLHATKNVDDGFTASYTIRSMDSFARFTKVLMLSGAYRLAVDLEKNSSLLINVNPTPEISDPVGKWNKCSIALNEPRQ
jgi:hypothetical protein